MRLFFQGLWNKIFKLKEGMFRLTIRKKLFPVRVVMHWHRLSREAACPIPLRVQGQVEWGLQQPGPAEGNPSRGMGVEAKWFFKVPSNPNHVMIL